MSWWETLLVGLGSALLIVVIGGTVLASLDRVFTKWPDVMLVVVGVVCVGLMGIAAVYWLVRWLG